MFCFQNLTVMIKLIVGIDVSKATLDVCFEQGEDILHYQVSNDVKGFKQLLALISCPAHIVMENSGPYYLQLAVFLREKDISVSVVNSLSVKRFIQMKGGRSKSDKKDAYWIMRYGKEQPLIAWEVPGEVQVKCTQIYRLRGLYVKQLNMLSNQLDSIISSHFQTKEVVQSLKSTIKKLKGECKKLEGELDKILKEHHHEQYKNLQTIPGIGKHVAMTLIIKTNGFERVESYRQLISMAGLSPREYSSGSSVRGKVRITKFGGKDIRKALYLSSMTAIRYNPQCKALFDRMKCRGKNGKVALIAVSNKLLKQAFAIAKSGVPYMADYRSQLVVN